jgi:hypothetical protein
VNTETISQRTRLFFISKDLGYLAHAHFEERKLEEEEIMSVKTASLSPEFTRESVRHLTGAEFLKAANLRSVSCFTDEDPGAAEDRWIRTKCFTTVPVNTQSRRGHMSRSEVNRRKFNKLAAAAFGGLLAGTGMALADDQEKENKKSSKKNPLLFEPHVCRGLNTCKNKGKSEKNDCAGMGNCATVKAHTCKAANDCRGQGGCGEHPGENSCNGKGECGVPLSDKAWPKARKRFKELMEKEGKKIGEAPEKS